MNAEKKQTPALPKARPATDILEDKDGYHIYLDVPGLDKSSMTIDLNENELIVSGATSYPEPGQAKPVHAEFGNGEYQRTFTISDTVDRDRIKASLVNGVLELFLPKAEKALPKKIEIQAG